MLHEIKIIIVCDKLGDFSRILPVRCVWLDWPYLKRIGHIGKWDQSFPLSKRWKDKRWRGCRTGGKHTAFKNISSGFIFWAHFRYHSSYLFFNVFIRFFLIPHRNQPLSKDPGWFLLGTHSGPSYTDCQSVLHSSAGFVRPAGRPGRACWLQSTASLRISAVRLPPAQQRPVYPLRQSLAATATGLLAHLTDFVYNFRSIKGA